MTITLDPAVRDVLERSTIDATSLTLPGQLDRKLYERVKKVIAAAGGTWNRKAATHLFPRDPRAALGLALEEGAIVDPRKALGQFFTPPALAAHLCETIAPGERVLEPSAGAGAIAAAARTRTQHVHCVELDATLARELAARGFDVEQADFLTLAPTPTYDVVVMNPPFNDGTDVRHVRHAMLFLRPGGRLHAIMAGGLSFRQDRPYRELRTLLGDGAFRPLPIDAFKAAGTQVHTVHVTWRRPPC